MAKGVCDARPCDTFGVGVFYNEITDDLKDTFKDNLIPGLNIPIEDEMGAEIFYEMAIAECWGGGRYTTKGTKTTKGGDRKNWDMR